MVDEKFYSTKESAKFLNVSVRKLQYLRQSGELIPDRAGKNNSVFYSESQLKRFKARTVVSPLGAAVAISSGDKADNGVMIRLVDVLPSQHFSGVTKLMKKLQVVEIGQGFKTAFD